MRLAVPYPARRRLADAYFFPVTAGAIDYAAPQTVTRDGDRLMIATKAKASRRGRVEGVLRDRARAGARGHRGAGRGRGSRRDGRWLAAALLAFGGAVLGGLILNVMPCVFPILSLKALSLARGQPTSARRGARRWPIPRAWCWCASRSAALILGLRAGGATRRLGVPVAGPARRSCCCCC